MTVSSRSESPETSAWTNTLLASSADRRFQPAILPLTTLATRVPAEFSQRASSRRLSSFRSSSR